MRSRSKVKDKVKPYKNTVYRRNFGVVVDPIHNSSQFPPNQYLTQISTLTSVLFSYLPYSACCTLILSVVTDDVFAHTLYVDVFVNLFHNMHLSQEQRTRTRTRTRTTSNKKETNQIMTNNTDEMNNKNQYVMNACCPLSITTTLPTRKV